jgi:hypothetical protein
VERLRRLDHDTLELQLTIEDPKAYTRSFTAKKTFKLSSFPIGARHLAAREIAAECRYRRTIGRRGILMASRLPPRNLSRNPSVAAQLRGACSCHFEMRTAVLLPAAFIGLRAEGPLFSVADRLNSVNGHSLRY